jgi:hypothetical protein
MEIAELRSKIDPEKLYVDFGVIRTALSVATLTRDLQLSLSEPSKEGECRGSCPKCGKDRAFSLNINTNRFNCFAKGCTLKGGGVIDFFAKLYEVPAKEASHLLAYAYGIQPYNEKVGEAALPEIKQVVEVAAPIKREVPEPSPDASEISTQQSAQYLIASIEQHLAELKQLLTNP